jgi:hypothetical protein
MLFAGAASRHTLKPETRNPKPKTLNTGPGPVRHAHVLICVRRMQAGNIDLKNRLCMFPEGCTSRATYGTYAAPLAQVCQKSPISPVKTSVIRKMRRVNMCGAQPSLKAAASLGAAGKEMDAGIDGLVGAEGIGGELASAGVSHELKRKKWM